MVMMEEASARSHHVGLQIVGITLKAPDATARTCLFVFLTHSDSMQ